MCVHACAVTAPWFYSRLCDASEALLFSSAASSDLPSSPTRSQAVPLLPAPLALNIRWAQNAAHTKLIILSKMSSVAEMFPLRPPTK